MVANYSLGQGEDFEGQGHIVFGYMSNCRPKGLEFEASGLWDARRDLLVKAWLEKILSMRPQAALCTPNLLVGRARKLRLCEVMKVRAIAYSDVLSSPVP